VPGKELAPGTFEFIYQAAFAGSAVAWWVLDVAALVGQVDFTDTRRYRIATAQLYTPQ
jgi:hypothetical protein